ncbi:RNA-binding protein [Helicobacter sp. 13S00482-2]|uniref:RNA-binding protein n=1 Tax=Helicobacter cappadocius TaxID=3063998 RepID=A0AA90PL78_9HELI|nr:MULTISPECIES: RNA-binding protein [unclassified Helicobacter]MDO7253592.1 RNA-binding protein [Helicobacter sp. faydin-H75]MDP2539520.1 RNA-binding protein [Helicobacter sp. faydin-H76]PAF53331.1 RNA-binding protein [Helicobacter sp. 13S00482-2]
MKSIYVGNLAYNATNEDVKELFSKYGNVVSVKLISDRETDRAKGFGFVEMEDDQALKAISSLNETDFMGRTIRVNEANPKTR